MRDNNQGTAVEMQTSSPGYIKCDYFIVTHYIIKTFFDEFLVAPSHIYKRLCPSVGPSVRPSVGPSVCPVLFSNDEKRHFPCSNDDEISYGARESRGQYNNDIKIIKI